MVRICITITPEFLERLRQHQDFARHKNLNDTFVELATVGMFDLEECDSHELVTRH